MGRAPCCDKGNVKKGPWCPEEDEKLKSYIQNHGTGGNWITLPHKIGLKRCGKSCRLRWLNYLRPNIKHGGFSHEEDSIICSLYIAIGSRWSIIAAQLPGRTDNDIKNHWNTKLKTMLLGAKNNNKNRAAAAPSPPNSMLNSNYLNYRGASSSSRPYDYANAAGAPAGAQYYDTTTTSIHNNYYSVLQIMSSMGGPDMNHHVMSTFPGNSNYVTHHDDDDRSSQLDVAPSLFILPHHDLPASSMHHHHQDPVAATAPTFSSWIPQSDTIFNQDGSPPPTWPNYDHVFPPAHHHHHHHHD